MKRIIFVLVLLFSFLPVFSNEITFDAAASYSYKCGYSANSIYSYSADPSFGSTLGIKLTTDYVDANVKAAYHNNNKSINAKVSPKYNVNDNVCIISNVVYNFSNVDYTRYTLNEHSVVANVGISLKQSFWFFDVTLGAYVGYSPLYLNFRNLCETSFDINIDVSKYLSVYFEIESFQQMNSLFSYNSVFVKNTCCIEAHYTFDNGPTIFASWTHMCAHPELPWNIKTDIYNKSENFITLGVRYALPF